MAIYLPADGDHFAEIFPAFAFNNDVCRTGKIDITAIGQCKYSGQLTL